MTSDWPLWRRVLAEVAHPFRGGRAALWDLLAGSWVLVQRGCAWVMEPGSWKERGERAAMAAGGAVVGALVVHQYAVEAVPVVLVVWSACAWAVSPVRPVVPTAPRNDQEKDELGESDSAPDPHPNLAHFIIRAVHAATLHGRRGIHIADLLDELHRAGLSEQWAVGDLRDWCERSGFPVRRGLQIRGVGNTYGIHVDDLTEALGMPLSEALAGLGDSPSPTTNWTPVGPPDPGPIPTDLEAAADPSPAAVG